jgi:hypothetical protein
VTPPVRGFALTGAARACATPSGAYANCLALSVRYARWLRERDIAAGLLALRGSRAAFPSAAGRWPVCEPDAYAHWVTLSGDWAVDWTWRQFDPTAGWPVVLPVEQVIAGWLEHRVWACERCPELVADRRHQDLAPVAMAARHLAIARDSAGAGPFPDPRHDHTAALAVMCACAAQPV